MPEVELPRKPSELLRIAVRDCLKVEKMEDRVLDMTVFHVPDTYTAGLTPQCAVCMAGAVMDQTLGVDPNAEVLPREMGENRDPLLAINELRNGDLLKACFYLDIPESERVEEAEDGLKDILAPSYDHDALRSDWDAYMRAADYLESVGL